MAKSAPYISICCSLFLGVYTERITADREENYGMKKQIAQNKIETIGNGIALILGLAFLGDIFELWNFSPFSGWWILFLYIPAVCGFLTKGVTAGGVMLALTAIVLTVGIFTDVDGRLWSVAKMEYTK